MTYVVTPSSHWQGTPHPGSRWTVQQINTLMKAGRDPAVVQTVQVRRGYDRKPGDWMSTPVLLTLPSLALKRDGRRAQIITPAGVIQWMDIVHA